MSIVGCSKHTVRKQEVLADISPWLMSQLAGAARNTQWSDDCIHIVDINAGPGHMEGEGEEFYDVEGSPLILEKASRPYQRKLYFIEKSKRIFAQLTGRCSMLQNISLINADHNDLISEEMAGKKLLHYARKPFGLIYHDPNGTVSWRYLSKLSQRPDYSCMDILIHMGGTTPKRAAGVGHDSAIGTCDGLRTIKKRRWFIRPPEGRQQWTFLLGTNSPKLAEFREHNFVEVNTNKGIKCLSLIECTIGKRKECRCTEHMRNTCDILHIGRYENWPSRGRAARANDAMQLQLQRCIT